MRTFLLLLAGQVVSQIGTRLTAFALGVWIYQQTGSLTLYSMIIIASTIPGIVVVPLAGMLMDRWDRRLTLLVAHATGGSCALAMAFADHQGALTVGLIISMVMIKSVFETITVPVFNACTPMLVPKEQLGRCNGLVQLGEGICMIAAPTAAGLLLPMIGLRGIFLIDLTTFACAAGSLALLPALRPPSEASSTHRGPRGFFRDALAGLAYLRGQPGLIALLAVGSTVNFCFGSVQLLFSPLVLTLATPRVLGIIESIGGVGLVLGSVVLSIWGGPRRRVAGLLSFMALQGAILFLAVATPSIALAGIGIFCMLATFPFIAGLSQTLWQRVVPLDLHGRVFSLRLMMAKMVFSLSFLIVGPLSDGLFEPWMAPRGALAGVLGPVLGVGPGRGVALLMAVLGVLIVATALLTRLYGPLRSLDDAPSP